MNNRTLKIAPHGTSRLQSGMTLVEALVALVVLSIGMLGIAALYVETTSTNRTALIRTQAVSLVNDMSDRIRAHPRARNAYAMATWGGAPAQRNCVAGVNCSCRQLAEDDLSRWVTTVRATLPGANPTADVTYTAAASAGLPDRYRVLVGWTEPGLTQAQSFEANVQLIAAIPEIAGVPLPCT